MSRRTLVIAVLAAIAVTLGCVPPDPTKLEVYGTVRWVDRDSWMVLDDAGHQPSGIASVVPYSNRVRVTYDECVYRVGYLHVTPDEAFTAAGVRVGASVGLCYADLFFYMGTSQTPVDPRLLSRAGANVWISGEFFTGG